MTPEPISLLLGLLRWLLKHWRPVAAAVAAALLLAALALLQGRVDALEKDKGLLTEQLAARQERLDAALLQITVLEAAIDAAVEQAEIREREAAAALAAARRQNRRHTDEIDRLRRYRPATGSDCTDALSRLQDYRSRQK